MPGRKIAPLEINGKTIWVEVDDIALAAPATTSEQQPDATANPSSDMRRSATPVGPVGDAIKGKMTDVMETLEAIVSTVDSGIKKVSPDEWSVELSIGFAGEGNIPYIAKGSVNSGVKVSAKWKKSDS